MTFFHVSCLYIYKYDVRNRYIRLFSPMTIRFPRLYVFSFVFCVTPSIRYKFITAKTKQHCRFSFTSILLYNRFNYVVSFKSNGYLTPY